MGNYCCFGNEAAPEKEQPDELLKKPLFEKKVDPKELSFMNETGKLLVKKTFIAGQQFLIDGCKECQILLLDWTAQVMVDYCEDCLIFIPPCASSVFLRNCKNCKVVVACQQLRTRECENVDFNIFSQTAPSIESSTKLRFSCWGLNYFSMSAHLKAADLDPWDNMWAHVYDFTTSEDNEKNWSLMSDDESKILVEAMIKQLRDLDEISLISNEFVVPPTKPEPEEGKLFFIISNYDEAYNTLRSILEYKGLVIVQTASRKLTKEQRKTLDLDAEAAVGFKCYFTLPDEENKIKDSFNTRSDDTLNTFFMKWAPKVS